MMGKFIVIDGTDGTGKNTQTNLLIKRFKEKGHKVKKADFPQYNKKSAGLIEEYLEGKYGSANEVGPYRASIFYACDRYAASFKIRKWIEEGNIVISNRYVTANLGHQGAKIKDKTKRKKFFDWILDLEYNIFQIPKPDLILILHVPADMAQNLAKKRSTSKWIGKTKDIHENNLNHLKMAEKTYIEISKIDNNKKLIECTKNGKILSKEEIHEMIWKTINFPLVKSG